MTQESSAHRSIETSLGPALERHGSLWVLDLCELPLFHGLSVLSRALAERVADQARADRIDINVERAIQPRENPELLTHLGVGLVKICAEHETIGSIAHHPELFEEHLRALFGTLQRQRYREALFPTGENPDSTALVFHFEFPPPEPLSEPVSCRFVLEFLRSARDGDRGYLRVTVEDPRGRRLSLDSIPHLEVEDLGSRNFIAGSTRIAQTWRDGLRRAAERRRRTFGERRSPYNHLFHQLDKAGLGSFEKVEITWGEDFVPRILESEPSVLAHTLKKILLALEDREVRLILERREVLRIDQGGVAVYLESAQFARVLHLSLGQTRERVDIDHFLERMPAIARVVEESPADALTDTAVFLIHHITADVLGVIAALRRLGCRDLTTLFVAYAGEAPGSYLSALLDLPAEEFTAVALTNVPEEGRTEGGYRLSSEYSSLDSLGAVARALGRGNPRFYEAMQSTAKILFLRQIARAREAGQRCLLIEDGGYLAPAINRACLRGETVQDFLRDEAPNHRDERLLSHVLEGTLIGSAEHTRNGYDQLASVVSDHGHLAYPAFSIAISRLKVEVEAREVAISILNAVENVLHASGMILSRRNCLVLGSRGAIGSALVDLLRHRLNGGVEQVSGVDLRADTGPHPLTADEPFSEVTRFGNLPQSRRDEIDLVLGVSGTSILQGRELADWVLRGRRPRIIFASGSTKTEEFKHLSEWMDGLLGHDDPELEGRPLDLQGHEVLDPLTGRVFGHRYEFRKTEESGEVRRRDVIFLANLTPVNFMFYGVPTELIDEVLAELLGSSLGLARRAAAGELDPLLHAVDREIDARGEPL
jgi:hypothetical protein